MPNPSGVVRSDSMNRTRGKHVHNYSTFKDSLSYKLANTLRFGDLTPSFIMEGVPRDEISLNSHDLIDSLSLKAPFKGSIRKIKDTFAVPNMAILPLNWDKIYVQPSNGDDVPTEANCVILDFPKRFSDFWLATWTLVVNNIPGSSATDSDVLSWLTALMRALVLGEYVYSHGSLLNVCGYHASAQFLNDGCSVAGGYDEFMDKVLAGVFRNFKSFKVAVANDSTNPPMYWIYRGLASGSVYSDDETGSFRALLEVFRENPLTYFYSTADIEYDVDKASFLADAATYSSSPFFDISKFKFCIPVSGSDVSSPDFDDLISVNNLNLSRILAYQIICAHYYTNSSLDPIYSAEIYREYFSSLEYLLFYSNGINFKFFVWNGRSIPLDILSGRLLTRLFFMTHNMTTIVGTSHWDYSVLTDTVFTQSHSIVRLAAFAGVFAYRKSLRYGDYFVGSRPRPLAPINTDVAVNSNMVSVIDITKKQWAQKFGNAVMRSRQKIEEYVNDLFGNAPAPDYHNPFFLASESELIFGDEVQNTADGQQQDANSRTSNFASNMNQFTFTFHNDDNHPCIYIQIISFDIKRFYTRSVDRQFLHLDRYDMFNPDFQYIGDQPIYGIELGYPASGYNMAQPRPAVTFGYQSRDMEYKQRFDQACGGFCRDLPGWILTDQDRSKVSLGWLDSDFIRSYNTELDQFFLSLTGYSLGSYFHFICITNNFVNAKRPMAVDPQILG